VGHRDEHFAVDVHEIFAHLRVYRPLVEECDLVEPAALAGERVTHDGAAALPGAQSALGLPLVLFEKTPDFFPALFFQRGLDTGHQLVPAIVVGVQVRFVSIVAIVDEHTPPGAQPLTRARGNAVAVVLACDLERAAVETIRIVVVADAILAARLGPPAADVGQTYGCEQRLPRRRGAEELALLLEITAIVEFKLIADAHEGA